MSWRNTEMTFLGTEFHNFSNFSNVVSQYQLKPFQVRLFLLRELEFQVSLL